MLGGAAYILSAIESPGVVRSGKARIVIGELQPGPPSDRAQRFAAMANAGGIDARASDDVRKTKWEKYVLLVAFSAVTAATQLTVGDIRGSEAASSMLRAIMTEAWSIGRALGVPLADDHVERSHTLVLAQADDEGTSLRHDLLTGHQMELEALQGTLRRLGKETGHRDTLDRRRLRDPPALGDPQRPRRPRGSAERAWVLVGLPSSRSAIGRRVRPRATACRARAGRSSTGRT